MNSFPFISGIIWIPFVNKTNRKFKNIIILSDFNVYHPVMKFIDPLMKINDPHLKLKHLKLNRPCTKCQNLSMSKSEIWHMVSKLNSTVNNWKSTVRIRIRRFHKRSLFELFIIQLSRTEIEWAHSEIRRPISGNEPSTNDYECWRNETLDSQSKLH